MATDKDYLMVDGVPGWCDFTEFYKLVALSIPDGAQFCEVGVWLGSSVIFLAKELKRLGKNRVRITCVDTWEGGAEHVDLIKQYGGSYALLDMFYQNVAKAGVISMIVPMKFTSTQMASFMADSSFWGVFLDGDHSSEAVASDLCAWYPKVIAGGIFSGHDYDMESVRKPVNSFAMIQHLTVGSMGRVWILK